MAREQDGGRGRSEDSRVPDSTDVLASAPVEEPILEGPALWEEEFKGASLGALMDAQLSLTRELGDLTKEYYGNCLEQGLYEELQLMPDEEGRFELPYDADELCTYVASPDGTVKKVVLPRDQFGDAYELKEKLEWLLDFRDRRAREEGVRGY